MSCLPVRLQPGADLKRSLEDLCRARGESAFVLSGLGSLQDACLRFAGEAAEARLPGLYEILSLSGTVTPDGAHLHTALSDAQGAVVGGHVGYGNAIRTTAEVLLVFLEDWSLGREFDEATGFKELVVRPPAIRKQES